MFDKSRINLYDYLYNLFYGVVTNNVYAMSEPQELTKSDAEEGFIIIRVGDMVDASEFDGETYGMVRCFVEAFIPPISRGRLDYDMYAQFEQGILDVIDEAAKNPTDDYCILSDTMVSMDGLEMASANSMFFGFVKSFIINIG